jgi:dihydrodipicolinate synthase/N-acetylneuraminate lyase
MSFDASSIDRLKNVHSYVVTPFAADDLLRVDLAALAANVEFQLERGVQVIAVGGGTGEIEALAPAELEKIARTALGVAGSRTLVIAGLPGNLAQAVELARCYDRIGIRVALAMPPLLRAKIPADLEGVFQYYRMLAEQSGLALIPYNTQAWPAEFIAHLAEVDSIVALKDPCDVPHEFFKAIRRVGDRLVWIGNKQHDPGVLHFRYQMGMQGFTSGQCNFLPQYELAMHEASRRQDWDTIVALQKKVAPLEQLRLAHDDAAMVKAAMDMVGLRGGKVRPPRRDVSPGGRAALKAALEALGVESIAPTP